MARFDIFKKRKKNTHKGDYGHLLIIAGSLGMGGAACMAAEASLRSGCGLVTLGVPKSLNMIVSKKLTEVIIKPLSQTKDASLSKNALFEIVKLVKNKDALAIGPGLSQGSGTKAVVLKLLPKLNMPAVIDADALNILAQKRSILKKIKTHSVLTPHPGEMARLINSNVGYVQKNRKAVAQTFANKYNVILVLKGHNTVVAGPKNKAYINKTGNPGMATAGSGDVLAGIIGSFLAQGAPPFEAARLGVYIHGLAGDLAAKKIGEVSLIASDILKSIPDAIRICRRSSAGRAAVL